MKASRLLIRSCFLCLMLIGLLFTQAQAASIPGPPSGNGILPFVAAGNPDYSDLGFTFGFKPQPEPPPTGIYTFPDGINTVTITTDGTFFDWVSTILIDAVIVKGGPDANVFMYNPFPAFSDTELHAPINTNNNKPFAISHIEFAYGGEVPIPAAVYLLGAGFVGLIGLRKKLKK
jgi:hypothetical protein